MASDSELRQKEQQTLDSYNQNVEHWERTHLSKSLPEEYFEKLREHLPAGSLLEVGCANGRDAIELIKLGYRYTGIDASSELIEKARARLPKEARLFVRSFYDLQFSEESFDGFWAAAVYLHAPKERLPEALRELHRIVKPRGIGFLSMKKGTGSEISREEGKENGPEYVRYFAYYSDEELRQVLTEVGFGVLEAWSKTMERLSTGTSADWLYYILQKA